MKISCIVPVYNEGARVKDVLEVLVGHPLIDEVIVVNDGSTDNSEDVLKGISGINLISYSHNKGKSYAVQNALLAAKNEWILMIDSDLVGLKKKNIDDLVAPVSTGSFDVSIALWGNSLPFFKFFKLSFMSGLRVFRKKIITDISVVGDLPGFGLEVFLNDLSLKNHDKIAVVYWENVIALRKSVKRGVVRGKYEDWKMFVDMCKTIGFFGVLAQFVKMIFRRKFV